MISLDDRGLTLGVGLFETVLVEAGRPVFWEAHLERLQRACARLDLPAPARDGCAQPAAAALDQAGLAAARAALRLSWTGGPGGRGLAQPPSPQPRLFATAAPAPAPPSTVSLATATVRRNPSSLTSRLKTLSYLDNVCARREATDAGADEALMLNTRGALACAAAANLFWLEGEDLCTPALDQGALDGIVRAQVLEAAPQFGFVVREAEAGPEALLASDGAIITNSLIGAVAVRALDGRPLNRRSGRLDAILSRFSPDAMIAAERDPQKTNSVRSTALR